MLSLGLITLWFVVGALVAFVANLLGVDDLVQIVVFLVVSVACLVLLRPVFVKYRKHGAREEPTLVGQPVVVCEDIDNDRMVGRVETGRPHDVGRPVLRWQAPRRGRERRGRGAGKRKLIVERKPSC